MLQLPLYLFLLIQPLTEATITILKVNIHHFESLYKRGRTMKDLEPPLTTTTTTTTSSSTTTRETRTQTYFPHYPYLTFMASASSSCTLISRALDLRCNPPLMYPTEWKSGFDIVNSQLYSRENVKMARGRGINFISCMAFDTFLQ